MEDEHDLRMEMTEKAHQDIHERMAQLMEMMMGLFKRKLTVEGPSLQKGAAYHEVSNRREDPPYRSGLPSSCLNILRSVYIDKANKKRTFLHICLFLQGKH